MSTADGTEVMSYPRKAADLVVEAIRNMRSKKGFTCQEIVGFIKSQNPALPSRTVRCVHTAIRRGEQCGILALHEGRYTLRADNWSVADGPQAECGCGKRYKQIGGSSRRRRSSKRRGGKRRHGGGCRRSSRRRSSRSRSRRRSSRGRSCRRSGRRSSRRKRSGGGRRKKINHTSRCLASRKRRKRNCDDVSQKEF